MLRSLDFEPSWDNAPPEIEQLIATAANREDEFLARRALRPVPSFHSSNFRMVYHALRDLTNRGLCSQRASLIEWGSGMGVVADIWSFLGGAAFGIEADKELAEASNRLAQELNIQARFVCGNFMPEPGWQLVDELDDTTRLVRSGECGYDQIGIPLAEFELVFVYPWPGERRLIDDVFDHCAASGAILMSFHGGDELRIQRKE